MRSALRSLLLAGLLLAGCGDDGGEPDDPEASTPSAEAVREWRLIGIVSASNAGGQVATTPVPLGDEAAVAEFSAQFTSTQLEQDLLRTVRANPPAAGAELVAAVVAVGCDAPTSVTYADGEVHALKPKGPTTQCLVPVTSVAILEVPV